MGANFSLGAPESTDHDRPIVMDTMSDESPCPFCRIVRGDQPTLLIYEDTTSIAFLDRAPAAPGHTLVVPREHARNLFDIDPARASTLFSTAIHVARLLKEALRPDGLTMIQTNEAAGWQSVFHFHLHLVPRWERDDLAPPWRTSRAPVDVLAATQSRILRAATAASEL